MIDKFIKYFLFRYSMKQKKRISFDRINKFVYSNFKLSLDYIKEIKIYVWFSVILFFGIGILGYMFPVFFEEQILTMIAELIRQTEGLSVLELIRFIFINNVKSGFFAVIFGVFLGIIPLIITMMNGYVLGFVANKTIAIEGVLVLWRLLPHGIFEIPAIMISIGLGLKLGLFLFFSKDKTWKEFKKWVVNSLRAFIFVVVPLLVVAGIIEGILIIFLG